MTSDELIAIHVFDMTPGKLQQKRMVEASIFRERTPSAKGIRSGGYEWPLRYSGQEIDRRMQELGLFDVYAQAIVDHVASDCTDKDILFALLTVTDEQRRVAALKAIGIV